MAVHRNLEEQCGPALEGREAAGGEVMEEPPPLVDEYEWEAPSTPEELGREKAPYYHSGSTQSGPGDPPTAAEMARGDHPGSTQSGPGEATPARISGGPPWNSSQQQRQQEVKTSKRSAALRPNASRGGGAYEAVQQERSPWFGAWPRLLTYKVIGKGCSQCLNCVHDFLRFVQNDENMQKLKLDFSKVAYLDLAATWWMEKKCYKDRRSAQDGKNLRSGILHLMPGQKGQLPLSSRASKSWEIQEGNIERELLCREFVGRTIEALAKRDEEMGWAAFSQSDCGLRGQDVEQLQTTGIDVTPQKVALERGVLSRGETTKTGTSQGVIVHHPDLADYFREVKRVRGAGERVFRFKVPKY